MSVKKTFKRFADKATIHGVARLEGSNYKLISLFWTILFLTSLTFLIYQVNGLVEKYQSNEFKTIISTDIENEPTDFPAVTICNTNPWVIQRVFELLAEFNLTNIAESLESPEQLMTAILSIGADAFNALKLSDFGFSLDEFLPLSLCKFDHKTCKPEMFSINSATNGNCYTFNEHREYIQIEEGIKSGLLFAFNIRRDEGIATTNFKDFTSVGAIITLHIAGLKIFKFRDRAILAPPNQLTRIKIKKRKLKRLKAPYKDNCTGNDERLGELPYSVSLCKTRCEMLSMFQACGVLDLEKSAIADIVLGRNVSMAMNSTQENCIWKVKDDLHTRKINCVCPPLCEDEEFIQDVSYGLWPSAIDMNLLKAHLHEATDANYTTEYMQRNFGAVEIYYEDFSVESIIHDRAYHFISFLSDLGGTSGLWLGASVFSFIELVMLLFELVASCFVLKKVKKKDEGANGI